MRPVSALRCSKTASVSQILHQRADAERPWLALIARSHPIDQLAQFRRLNRNDIIALVGETLSGSVTVFHRRKHRSKKQCESIRILMMQSDHPRGRASRRTVIHIISPWRLYGRCGFRSFRCGAARSEPASVCPAATHLCQAHPQAADRRRPKTPGGSEQNQPVCRNDRRSLVGMEA